MAKYITPALTITSNAVDATTNPGPTSSPLNISVSDLLDVTEVASKIVDASTTNAILFNHEDYVGASAPTIGTDGGFIFLRNLIASTAATTADIYIGHGANGALEGDTAVRLMTLKPGEFVFTGWDMQTDIIVDASAAVTDALEAILFVRTGTA